MTRWRAWLEAGQGLAWYVSLVVVVPLITLAGAGLLWLWQENLLISTLIFWLLLTLLAYAALVIAPPLWQRFQRRRQAARAARSGAHADRASPEERQQQADRQSRSSAVEEDSLPDQLPERADWSARDRAIWQQSCQDIELLLDTAPAWSELTALSLQTLSQVAEHYHGGKREARYRFTLPEVLLVVSVASARYRSVVMTHLPYAERINIGTVVSLVRHQDQIRQGFNWANRFRRVARLINPVGAVVGELRDHFTDKVLGQVGSTVQRGLQRLLLQEVAQAGIDLYSGRLKVSDEELTAFQSGAAQADADRRPEPPEPLRVLLIGQVSTGKSSLINALAETLNAETGRLPTTDRLTVHTLNTADGDAFHLVDTPGIDDDEERRSALVEASLEADLLIWLVRATQPARAPDKALLGRIDERFDALPDRRRPPMLLVMSHADGLSPKAEWAPPYDLNGDSRKAHNMRQALISVRDQLGLPDDLPAIPACVTQERGLYNIDAIGAQLLLYADDALGTQLNRRRIERASQSVSGRDRWRQLVGLGRALGRAVRKSDE